VIRDPVWKKNRIWDPGWEKVGSGINIPDPQHCKIDPDVCFQEQFLIIINVYCPRADPERADRLRYKLHFYKALDIRANRLRGRSLFPSKLFSFLSEFLVLFLTILTLLFPLPDILFGGHNMASLS
jgi:hypothetical protein